MRAEKVGADTLLSQIIHMVADAQRSRAPIQKLADTVAGFFVLGSVGTRSGDGLRHRERCVCTNGIFFFVCHATGCIRRP
jgi:hypothetical protein